MTISRAFLFATATGVVATLFSAAQAGSPIAEGTLLFTAPFAGPSDLLRLDRMQPGATPMLAGLNLVDPVGPPAVGPILGADFPDTTLTLYVMDQAGGPRLRSVNTSTLIATDIGPIAFSGQQRQLRWDPVGSQLFATTVSGGITTLHTINTSTAVPTTVGVMSDGGPAKDVSAIAVHPVTGQMYAVSVGTDAALFTVDKATGTMAQIAPLDVDLDTDGGSLEFEDSTGQLLYFGPMGDGEVQLRSVDLGTGATTLVTFWPEVGSPFFIGALASASTYGGSFQPDPLGSSEIFAVSAGRVAKSRASAPLGLVDVGDIDGSASFFDLAQGDFGGTGSSTFYFIPELGTTLHSLDTTTLVATDIGSLGLPVGEFPISLVWDAADSRMLLVTTGNGADRLRTVNLSTGATTLLSTLSNPSVGIMGLAFQPGTGTLFGVHYFNQTLCTIEPDTGAVTVRGPLGYTVSSSQYHHLTFDPANGSLYLWTNSQATAGDYGWRRVDPLTGASVQVATVSVDSSVAVFPGLSCVRFKPPATPSSVPGWLWAAFE